MHNATLTITNKETFEYRTFRISTAKKMDNKQIISILSGPDNEFDYEGFGFASDSGIVVWKRYKGNGKPSSWEYYARLIENLLGIKKNPVPSERYDILESRRCLRCNRTLTTPESIERGIGPECASMGY